MKETRRSEKNEKQTKESVVSKYLCYQGHWSVISRPRTKKSGANDGGSDEYVMEPK